MPYLLDGLAYHNDCEIVKAHGLEYLCYPRGFVCAAGKPIRKVPMGSIKPWHRWAPMPDVDDFAAAAKASAKDAKLYADEAQPTERHKRIGALLAIADGEVKDTKREYQKAEAAAGGLGVPNDLRAGRYKRECRDKAQARARALGLR